MRAAPSFLASFLPHGLVVHEDYNVPKAELRVLLRILSSRYHDWVWRGVYL